MIYNDFVNKGDIYYNKAYDERVLILEATTEVKMEEYLNEISKNGYYVLMTNIFKDYE